MDNKNENRNIITRRIRLFINYPNSQQDSINAALTKLQRWQAITYKAANLMTSLLYLQEQLQELSFFTDDYKIKLINNIYDRNGILNTSRMSSIYISISQKYKTQIPSEIIRSLLNNVYNSFNHEKKGYYNGTKSLRSYKNNIPVPITAKSIHNLVYDCSISNFTFSFFKYPKYIIPFRTSLGRDHGNVKEVIEKCISNKYKLYCSQYTINKNSQIYIQLSAEIPPLTKTSHQRTKIATAKISFCNPIHIQIGDNDYKIGNGTTFLYKRLAIQNALSRKLDDLKYCSTVKGKNNRLKCINDFKLKERNFINTYTHQISSQLIRFCNSQNVKKLILVKMSDQIKEYKDDRFIFRNWSLSSLIDKIKHKCQINNIELIIN
jgi:hypothetical protein